MAFLGFKSKSDEVVNHWIAFADSFAFSSQEFYEMIERELCSRKIPSLTISRVEYSEGGLLSDRRVYLRMIRERLAFDTCAAPFGTGFFFSCRTIYSPAVVRLWHILFALGLTTLIFGTLIQLQGLTYACISMVAFLLAVAQVIRNAGALDFSDLDSLLLRIPGLGPIYERWLRVETYYRHDTRLAYLDAVPKLVAELAEELTATKGIKLVRQYRRAPVLDELYKPVSSTKPQVSAT